MMERLNIMKSPRTKRCVARTLAASVAVAFAAVLIIGCTSEKANPTLPDAHPESWMDKGSVDFHGYVVLKRGWASCTGCHGISESGGRSGISCADCHGADEEECIACHGGWDNLSGAPPTGLRGEIDDSSLAVGAHTPHLEGLAISDGVTCGSCHIVPLMVWDSTHLDFTPGTLTGTIDSLAEVLFGGISPAPGAQWDRDSRTCSATYCHGNFSGGNMLNSPLWTAGGQASCGSCHAVAGNVASLRWKHEFHVESLGLGCTECHYGVVDSQLTIVGRNLHVNGTVDTLVHDSSVCETCHGSGSNSCTYCHGGNDNESGAPPRGLHGETNFTEKAVGAHTAHIDGGAVSDGINCIDCHAVPVDLSAPGHLGTDSIAEITWSLLAGAQSTWNRTTATCSQTYCHGNFSGGNPTNRPVWTASGQASCGSCHDVGSSPGTLGWKHAFHVTTADLDCADCHFSVVDLGGAISNGSLHVDGKVDLLTRDSTICADCHGSASGSCILCHGGLDNQTGAPPAGLRGELLTSERAVGAHTVHLEGGSLSDGIACEDCHVVPATLLDTGHLGADSLAELVWGNLAGNQSTWIPASATCEQTYCHGSFSGGNTGNTPVWTATGQAACGSCHDAGANPGLLGGRHQDHVEEGVGCYRCHSLTTGASLTIVGPAVHVDGSVQVSFSSGQGNYDNGQCSNIGCHGGETW